MSKKTCPKCWKDNYGDRETCAFCGADLSTGKLYEGPPKFVKPMWFNFIAVLAFLSAVGAFVIMVKYQGYYTLWYSVAFDIIAGLEFLFPIQGYQIASRRYYLFHRYEPDDYEEPEVKSIAIHMTIVTVFWVLMNIITLVVPLSE